MSPFYLNHLCKDLICKQSHSEVLGLKFQYMSWGLYVNIWQFSLQ